MVFKVLRGFCADYRGLARILCELSRIDTNYREWLMFKVLRGFLIRLRGFLKGLHGLGVFQKAFVLLGVDKTFPDKAFLPKVYQ